MPIHYTIDEAANLIRVTHEGPFSIDELIAHSLRVNGDERFRPGMNTLTDLRAASLADRVDAIRDYVAHSAELEKTRGPCKWACLVVDESARDLIWSFDLLAKRSGVAIETRAFFDPAEAEAWLKETA